MVNDLFENEKDYNIHTPEADAERERRIEILKRDMNKRASGFSCQHYYCEKCGMWYHGPEFLLCNCLRDNEQMCADRQKEIEDVLKYKQ
jgi:hypothetical protein